MDAAELPRWVPYHRVARADHTESWNVDPRLCERRLTAFLHRIGSPEKSDDLSGQGSNAQVAEATGSPRPVRLLGIIRSRTKHSWFRDGSVFVR